VTLSCIDIAFKIKVTMGAKDVSDLSCINIAFKFKVTMKAKDVSDLFIDKGGQNHVCTVYVRCYWQENHQI
jgi:hypothetical protein